MRLASALATAAQAAIVVAVTGGLGVVAHQPWLFPSLAPTAVLQATPSQRSQARPWKAAVGHACGVLFGCVGVLLTHAQHAPSVLANEHLGVTRLAAAVLALLFTMLAMKVARAWHAPAAATTLIFAEGSYHVTGHDVLLVITGVALTIALGELLWRARRALARARRGGSSAPYVPRARRGRSRPRAGRRSRSGSPDRRSAARRGDRSPHR